MMTKNSLKEKLTVLIGVHSKKWLLDKLDMHYYTFMACYDEPQNFKVKDVELIEKLYQDEVSVLRK